MRQVYIVFYLILCSVFVTECQASSPDDIFGNMSYIIGDEDRSEKVTLVNGKYRDHRLNIRVKSLLRCWFVMKRVKNIYEYCGPTEWGHGSEK